MAIESKKGLGDTNLTPPCELAIIGIGCLFPKAAGPGYFWANVKKGVDCIGDVPKTHWNPDDYFDADPKKPDMTYARRGGFLDPIDFNPLEFGIAPRDLEATDTTQLLGLVAAKQALTDARIEFKNSAKPNTTNRPQVDRSRVSVILGVTGTLELVVPLGARLGHPHWKRAMKDAGIPDDLAKDAIERIGESYVPWQENSFPGLLGNVVAGRIANRLDLHGTNCVVDAACASSLSAIHLAGLELAAGRVDVVVTGGADTFNDIFMFMCFSKTPALSATGNSKPFDANGDGTILGEGIGTVVLKRRVDAERDGDTIYAVIKGMGTSSDGKGNAIYAPSADGQVRCITNAYHHAGITPDTIELVEAHGTGTKVGDGVEASALTTVFTSNSGNTKPRPWCALGSVKSQIGHTKAAAGVAGLIKAALALHNKVLPPTIKVTQPVEALRNSDSPFYVNLEARPWLPRQEHPRRAALSAFGFGGSNFHCVLEESNSIKAQPDWDGSVEIYAISGPTIRAVADSLEKTAVNWLDFARQAEESRKSFDRMANVRLVLVANREQTNLELLLKGAKQKLAEQNSSNEWFTPEGAYFGQGAVNGKLGVIFPGQGSQSTGMLRDLVNLFPEALDAVALANSLGNAGNSRLSDIIFPPTSFQAEAKAQASSELTKTDRAQPALGAVEWAAWKVLSQRFGIRADAFAGHSFGELTALAAADRISPADFFRMAYLRGQFMAQQSGTDAGGMTAALADAATVESVLAASGIDATIANRNSPRQTVISAANDDLPRVESALKARDVKCIRLPVSAAFHSRFVAAAAVPFRDALNRMTFTSSVTSVYANTTASAYPSDPVASRDILGNQLARPVLYDALIREMAASGVNTFVEVGPGGKLARMTAEILATDPAAAQNIACLSIESAGGKRGGLLDLAHVLARIATRGHTVDLSAWERESRCRPAAKPAKATLTIPICGANYVSPRTPRPPRPETFENRIATVEKKSMTDPVQPKNAEALALSSALDATQKALAALQKLQEQTAVLHRQFLDSQQQAQQTIAALIAQQHGVLGLAPSAVPQPIPAPVFKSVIPAVEKIEIPALVVVTPAPVPPPAPPVAKDVKIEPARILETPPKQVKVNPVDQVLLEVVSEKTGYPVSTLDLSMSLDSDLGVDSIKRVEILSALQERLPDAPVVKPEQLGTLHTLKDVADFLSSGSESPVTTPISEFQSQSHETIPIKQITAITKSVLTPEPVKPANEPKKDSKDEIAAVLLDVVSQKTGYPVDTLDLNMTMDDDLGIDSIKRVEILSAIQERLPNAPTVKPEHLGTLRSLKELVDFLRGTNNPLTAKIAIHPEELVKMTQSIMDDMPLSTQSQQAASKSELAAPATEAISKIRQAVPSESVLLASATGSRVTNTPAPRNYDSSAEPNKPLTHFPSADPIDRSILQAVDLDTTAVRSRILIPEGRDIIIVGEENALTRDLIRQIQGMGYSAILQSWAMSATARFSESLSGLILVAPSKANNDPTLNRQAFQWIQRAGGKIRNGLRPGSAGIVLSVSMLDGSFGITAIGPGADSSAGGFAGLIKTVHLEWPELSTKAIDLAPSFVDADPAAAAMAVVEEAFLVGPVEVGISAGHRCTLDLARTVRRPTSTNLTLNTKDVVLVTGGARGVTAEASIALASACMGTIILTGRTTMPPAVDPQWIAGITDDAAMKKAAAEHLGATATPKLVSDLVATTLSHREIRETISRINATGAKASYYPVNVSNGRAVADLLHQVRVKHGPITVLVHGAGVLADRRIEQLTIEQFDQVYTTKADGAKNLLEMLRGEELKAIVFFGSTTGRFGRIGQIAYACANEALNKLAQAEARRRPSARVVCINWGPWEGGMVTPGLKKMFESEGIGTIPLTEGGQFVIQELMTPGRSVEVIAMGKLRSGTSNTPTPQDYIKRQSPLGGGSSISTAIPQAPPATAAPAPELNVAFERTIDVPSHPILRSHVLDGRAVLPMALHMEWLAHAALHGNPGLMFFGLDNLRITSGIQIEDGASAPIKALAGRAVKQDKVFVVPVELRGKRKDGREVVHSRAEVLLTATLPKAPIADRLPTIQPYPHPVDEVYKYFLFHGPDFHGIERVEGLTEVAFVGGAYPSPPPTEWFSSPLRSNWVADPLAIDTSFQMLILWSFAQHGAGSLPCFAGRYRQYRRAFPAGVIKVVARVTRDNGTFARADIDYLDSDGTIIAQMQDYECVIDAQLNMAFRRNQLASSLVRA